MTKLIKMMMTGLLSIGGISAASLLNNEKALMNHPSVHQNETQNVQNTVTLEDARTTALNEVPGTVQVQSEDDDAYIFIIAKDDYLYQVEIDKKDGRIDDIDRVFNDVNAISVDEARTIALSQVDGTVKKFEVDDDEYTIEIEQAGYLYEVEIDRFSGMVMEIECEVIENAQVKMTLEEAKNIALKKVDGTIKNIETDDDEYTITIEKDDWLYEIEINQLTGNIEDIDKERASSAVKNITAEEAKKIALQEVNGEIRDIDYDRKMNVYEIEVQTSDRQEYDIEIDAWTGTVNFVKKDD